MTAPTESMRIQNKNKTKTVKGSNTEIKETEGNDIEKI